MALRIRKNGDILCAAHTEPKQGDTYINDDIHYYLAVMTEAIRASNNHEQDNLWFWNIKQGLLKHEAETRYNEEVLRPRRKDKKYIAIQRYA